MGGMGGKTKNHPCREAVRFLLQILAADLNHSFVLMPGMSLAATACHRRGRQRGLGRGAQGLLAATAAFSRRLSRVSGIAECFLCGFDEEPMGREGAHSGHREHPDRFMVNAQIGAS